MKEQPKVYKHPILGWTARLMYHGSYEIERGTEPLNSIRSHFTEEQIVAMGFDLVQEEQTEWLLLKMSEHRKNMSYDARKSLEDIAKHYPQQDTLPVEEIVDKMKDSYDINCMIPVKLWQGFEDILRTYAIKDTSLIPLDVAKIMEEANLMLVLPIHSNTPIFLQNLRGILSKYGTPKITEEEIDEYMKDFLSSAFAVNCFKSFLRNKGLLAE